MADRTCASCTFVGGTPRPGHVGECRRAPPAADPVRRAVWPMVRATDGCGEHKAAKVAKTAEE